MTEAKLKAVRKRAKEEREREEAERLHREQAEAQEQMREEIVLPPPYQLAFTSSLGAASGA